jgi:hypothetical protein
MPTPEEIRACADAILDDYDDANVRSFITAIVTRRARECVRADECAVLARSTQSSVTPRSPTTMLRGVNPAWPGSIVLSGGGAGG